MSNRRMQNIDDVKATMALIKKADARAAMANAMLRVGNLTDEARAWVAAEYPQ